LDRHTAAGVIGFVCLMFFRSTDFPTVFHDTTNAKSLSTVMVGGKFGSTFDNLQHHFTTNNIL
jgi:hypothetical protein